MDSILKIYFRMNYSYCDQNPEELAKELETSLEKGLTEIDVEQRLKKFGKNSVTTNDVKGWEIFLRQFKSPFIYLLIFSSLLSLFLKQYIDASMILIFILINTTLGFLQEYRSEQTIKLLKKYVRSRSRVMREGQERLIDSKELVPGDIVLLELGDLIPADVRFIQVDNLIVDESILTGESMPSQKLSQPLTTIPTQVYEAKNLGFSGTTIVNGEALAVVIETGKSSTIGNITELTAETIRVSNFEKNLTDFSKFILKLVIVTLSFIVIINILIRGGNTNISELVIFAIALAVGVVPEGLPVVTTFALSRGALLLAKNKVVVKRLSAIEDLGSIEVLCTDKTGTLTENKLTVHDMFSEDKEQLLFYASLASPFLTEKEEESTNSFDVAIWNKISPEMKKKIKDYKKVRELPFDPKKRKNCTVVSQGAKQILIVRGAPEEILKLSKLQEEILHEIHRWIAKEGREGRRTLAIGIKDMKNIKDLNLERDQHDLTLIGIISFFDPIKTSVKDAINKAKMLGVHIKLLTGDSQEVAGAVAAKIGLISTSSSVITGKEFERLPTEKQRQTADYFSVFARVSPQQKYLIIKLLQENYEVGFLGEGINDAPSLKLANVALVVNNASDIAREASDIVLLEKRLGVIIEGIQIGRQVFNNTIKYIKATLSSNFGNFYAVAISSFFINYLPMIPIQILLVNLLSDSPMIAIATDNNDPAELKRPKNHKIRELIALATILGIVSTVFDFILFSLFFKKDPAVLQTNWFIVSILTELVFLFSIRTHLPFYKAKQPSLPLLFLTVFACLVTIIIPFTQFGHDVFKFISPTQNSLLIIGIIVICYFAATETAKLIYYKFNKIE